MFLILLTSLILSTSLFSKQTTPIWVRTTPPDYNKMIIVDTSASTTTILKTKKVNGKKQYVTFTEAYSEFHKKSLATIKSFIKKNNFDGVCNWKISFEVTKDGYYFLSTYDAYVYK